VTDPARSLPALATPALQNCTVTAIAAALKRDPHHTNMDIARACGVADITVLRARRLLEQSGDIPAVPRGSRTRSPGAGDRARAALLADPARSDEVIAIAANCTPPTVLLARRDLEAVGMIDHIPVRDRSRRPHPAPPSLTRDAIAKLGPFATPRQVADLAGVSIQAAWRMIGIIRTAPQPADSAAAVDRMIIVNQNVPPVATAGSRIRRGNCTVLGVPFGNTHVNGEPMDRHLNVFLPYERLPGHEDQLTRTAMIVMRAIPWHVTRCSPGSARCSPLGCLSPSWTYRPGTWWNRLRFAKQMNVPARMPIR